ncbi:MAG: hypothetical protein Q4G13_01355 [Moraxella sp.]|nr:hypothetical protein [Moraxella sp.]
MSEQRLDIAIATSWQMRRLWLAYLGVGVLLAFGAGLSWWQWSVFTLSVLLVWWLYRIREVRVIQLISPNGGVWGDWQLVVQSKTPKIKTADDAQLWQAELIKLTNMSVCIVFEFWVYEPMPRPLTVRIYPDQATQDEWRQLCKMVRFG